MTSTYGWKWKLGLITTCVLVSPFVGLALLLERLKVPLTDDCKNSLPGSARRVAHVGSAARSRP